MKIQVTITIETYMLTNQVTEQMLKEALDDVIAFNCCDNETAYDAVEDNNRIVSRKEFQIKSNQMKQPVYA